MQQGYLNFQRDCFKLAAMPFKIEHVPYGPPYHSNAASDSWGLE